MPDSLDFMNEVIDGVLAGSLDAAESLLTSQAYLLNATFATEIIAARESQYIAEGEFHANIALRAQNQCQRTLRTLLEFKNPKRATFIKQQNNLQVTQAEDEKEKGVEPANEVLEHDHESRLDTRAPQEASRSNQDLETVGKIHRPKDS